MIFAFTRYIDIINKIFSYEKYKATMIIWMADWVMIVSQWIQNSRFELICT